MARGSRTPSKAVATEVDGAPEYVELNAFVDEPRRRVDVRSLAPFGWTPAIILALVGFIDRVETSITGGVLEKLKEEFGFSDAVAGALFSAPIIASLLLIIPAGVLADTKRRRDILVVVLVLWSVFSLGSGAAPALIVFLLFRVLLGAAAPLNIPPTSSLLGDYYPRRARTKAFSIAKSAENMGMSVGVLVGALVGAFVGWRAAFFVVGVPGLVLAFLVHRLLKEPVRGIGDAIDAEADRASGQTAPRDADEPDEALAFSAHHGQRVGVTQRFRQVFAIATVRRLVLGQAVLFAAFAGVFSFGTSFFARFYFDDAATVKPDGSVLIDDSAIALAGILVAGLSIPAIGLGAWAASRIDHRWTGENTARRIFVAVVALFGGAAAITLFCVASPLALRLFFFLAFVGINILAVSNLAAAVADVIPASIRGSGFAILQMCLALGSAFGPAIVGIGSAVGGDDLRWGFLCLIVPLIVGAAIVARARSTYAADAERVVRGSAV